MCGIWALLLRNGYNHSKDEILDYNSFMKVKNRGPDTSTMVELSVPFRAKLGFHRLAIMDQSMKGNQPFTLETKERRIHVICNGEIYNAAELQAKYNFPLKSGSDCEIIPHMYQHFGLKRTMAELIGEYAFMILDVNMSNGQTQVVLARDPFGVRPLYYKQTDGYLSVSSVMKGLINPSDSGEVAYVNPGSCLVFDMDGNGRVVHRERYNHYEFVYPKLTPDNKIGDSFDAMLKGIHSRFAGAVLSRMISDRPMGCLLSGGLDSSLVAAVVAREMAQKSQTSEGKKLRTFAVGMEGSPDLKYAQMVADHIGSDHTTIQFTAQEGIQMIPEVIYHMETYDITTIRAGVVEYLAAKYVSEKTDIKVLIVGEGSDEVTQGYMMFHNAPDADEGHRASVKLLEEIHLYDVIRADRCISSCGLEARVPFLDYRFVDYYMSLPKELRVPRKSPMLGITDRKVEKAMLREAFCRFDSKLIPKEVLLRTKDGQSDACSSLDKPWYSIIQDYVETQVGDQEFKLGSEMYMHNTPKIKEAYYYRKIYENFFGNRQEKLIPHYWLPWWSETDEPSGRTLSAFKENVEKDENKVNEVKKMEL